MFDCGEEIRKKCESIGGIVSDTNCTPNCTVYLHFSGKSSDDRTEEEQESEMPSMNPSLMHNIDECFNRKFYRYIDDIDRGTQIQYKCGIGLNRCYACKEFKEINK